MKIDTHVLLDDENLLYAKENKINLSETLRDRLYELQREDSFKR